MSAISKTQSAPIKQAGAVLTAAGRTPTIAPLMRWHIPTVIGRRLGLQMRQWSPLHLRPQLQDLPVPPERSARH